MRCPKALVAVILTTALSTLTLAVSSEELLTGRQIIEQEEKQNKGRDEFNEMSMKLINDRGQERNRKVEYYRQTDENDNDKILMRFLEPADVKGVGLLTIEHSDRDDDQWLYLPALRKVRRISAADQTDNFMGTDFTYEDIRSEKYDEHEYKLLGSDVIDGYECYLIEALPATEKQKRESGYSRREIWVRKDILLTVQVKFYDRKGELVKVEVRKDIIEAAPNIYRPNFMEMKNLKTGHTTQLTFDQRRINQGIPDRIFSERELKRG
ncbi:MAG: outer membrane lipoprotein-sorting protein [Candidatus Abyssubacteria bacterium]